MLKTRMIPQNGKHIGCEGLLFQHGGLDDAHLFCRPAHFVDGQSVELLLDGLIVAHGVDIVHHYLGGLILQRFSQDIIRLPDQLLGSPSNIGGDSLLPIHFHGREIGIDLAVADEDHIVTPGLIIILGDHAALHQLGGVFGCQQTGNQAKNCQERQEYCQNRKHSFNLFHVRAS